MLWIACFWRTTLQWSALERSYIFSLVSLPSWEQVFDCPSPPVPLCEHLFEDHYVPLLVTPTAVGTHYRHWVFSFSLSFSLHRQGRADVRGVFPYGSPSACSLEKPASAVPGSRARFPGRPGHAPAAYTCCRTLSFLLWLMCLSQDTTHRDPTVTWPVWGESETVSLGVACLVLFNCCFFNQEMNSETDDSVRRQTSGNGIEGVQVPQALSFWNEAQVIIITLTSCHVFSNLYFLQPALCPAPQWGSLPAPTSEAALQPSLRPSA